MTDAQRDWRTFLIAGAIFGAFLIGWFVGVHQQHAIELGLRAEAAEGTRQGPLSASAVSPSPLPPEVEDWLTISCGEVQMVSALQAAEAFSESARKGNAPEEWRRMHELAAINERLRVLSCLWWWRR